ncbi:MAG: glycosyltransferase [Parcubacteria group bacterium]|nr:glycosyltransferase [Parcubacteria group bacterium]
MRVALVHDHLNQIGGAERVLLAMHRLWPDSPLFTLAHDPKKIADFFDDLEIRTSFIQKLPLSRSHLRWYLAFMPAAIESFDVSEYDVILSSASAFGKGVIAPPRSLHICYCHTPTRYLWSDAHTYVEEVGGGGIIRRLLPIVLNRLRMWDQLASARVDHFIANSRFVAGRIARYYNRGSTVIYPPVDVANYPMLSSRPHYALVSRLRPYKRVDIAIRAFNRLRMPLLIVGDGEELPRLRKLAGPSITFLGSLPEREKKRVLASARAFLHPQEEDFGISAIEAMAAGTPVIAYGAGGALETVTEGETGLFFEEQTWQSLADAVIRSRRISFDAERIRDHAEQFSEERFRREMRSFVEMKYAESRS